MTKDPMSELLESIDFPRPSFRDLRGRQSVRATFKLTSDCIDAIAIVAAQLGIKQKSLFDHLFQDMEALKAIGRKVRNARLQTGNRVQKTYVMSRTALLSLEDIANHFNAPRDALIEISVQRLLPIIRKERRRYAKRKEIFSRIEAHLDQGRKLLNASYSELGEDDLLTDRLTAAMSVFESAYKQMAGFLEKGKSIEDFEPEAFRNLGIVISEE